MWICTCACDIFCLFVSVFFFVVGCVSFLPLQGVAIIFLLLFSFVPLSFHHRWHRWMDMGPSVSSVLYDVWCVSGTGLNSLSWLGLDSFIVGAETQLVSTKKGLNFFLLHRYSIIGNLRRNSNVGKICRFMVVTSTHETELWPIRKTSTLQFLSDVSSTIWLISHTSCLFCSVVFVYVCERKIVTEASKSLFHTQLSSITARKKRTLWKELGHGSVCVCLCACNGSQLVVTCAHHLCVLSVSVHICTKEFALICILQPCTVFKKSYYCILAKII